MWKAARRKAAGVCRQTPEPSPSLSSTPAQLAGVPAALRRLRALLAVHVHSGGGAAAGVLVGGGAVAPPGTTAVGGATPAYTVAAQWG